MDDTTSFLEQTEEMLKEHGKVSKDVKWIGSADGKYSMDWGTFESISRFEYDRGFGIQVIAKDLVVVGENWWLERHEYDGLEWWEFKTIPIQMESTKSFRELCGAEATLDELNENDTQEE